MASLRIQKSPTQIASDDVALPDNTFADLLIRIESGGSFLTVFTLDGTTPSATNAHGFLVSGDAIELKGKHIKDRNAKNIRLLNITGDPKIYWRMT